MSGRHPSRGKLADSQDAREFYDELDDRCTNPGDVAKLTAAIEALAGAIRQYDRGNHLDRHERAGNLTVVLVRARDLVNRYEGAA